MIVVVGGGVNGSILQVKMAAMIEIVKSLQNQHLKLKADWQEAKTESQGLKKKIGLIFKFFFQGMCKAIEKQGILLFIHHPYLFIDKRVTGSVKKYKSEYSSRRSLLDKLASVKGNHRVLCVSGGPSSMTIPKSERYSILPSIQGKIDYRLS